MSGKQGFASMDPETRRVMFSAATGDHETPDDLFDQLNAEFHFGLDAAANEANHKCERWLGPGGLVPDALSGVRWSHYAEGKPIWLNPPYGRGIEAWLETAFAEAMDQLGHLGVVARSASKAAEGQRAKALLGPMGFSEEIHMLKCRFLEGAAENPRAYFNTLIKNAITNLQL